MVMFYSTQDLEKNILSKGESSIWGPCCFHCAYETQVEMSSGQVDINKQIMCELFEMEKKFWESLYKDSHFNGLN